MSSGELHYCVAMDANWTVTPRAVKRHIYSNAMCRSDVYIIEYAYCIVLWMYSSKNYIESQTLTIWPAIQNWVPYNKSLSV